MRQPLLSTASLYMIHRPWWTPEIGSQLRGPRARTRARACPPDRPGPAICSDAPPAPKKTMHRPLWVEAGCRQAHTGHAVGWLPPCRNDSPRPVAALPWAPGTMLGRYICSVRGRCTGSGRARPCPYVPDPGLPQACKTHCASPGVRCSHTKVRLFDGTRESPGTDASLLPLPSWIFF